MNSESTRSNLQRRWESELGLLHESARKSEAVTVHDRVDGEASVVIERRTTITVDEEVQVQTGVAIRGISGDRCTTAFRELSN